MLRFKDFLTESVPTVNIHQLHLEQLVFHGSKELNNSIKILEDVRDKLSGTSTGIDVTVKWDGCIHPDTILRTDKGDVSINDIINNNKEYRVMSYNHDSEIDEYNIIESPRINDNNKNWVEITFENGSTIKVTEDHELFTTNRGWVQAKDLNGEDDIKEMDT